MNLTNKQIREQARHLLDDNVFGKDWLKSVLTLALSFVVAYVIIFAAVAIISLTESTTGVDSKFICLFAENNMKK